MFEVRLVELESTLNNSILRDSSSAFDSR